MDVERDEGCMWGRVHSAGNICNGLRLVIIA